MSGLDSYGPGRAPLPFAASGFAMPPRRPPYAFVAAGTANSNGPHPSSRSGAFSYLSVQSGSETTFSSLLSSSLRAHRSQNFLERPYTEDTNMAGSPWGRSRSPYGSGLVGKTSIGGRYTHCSRYDPDHLLKPSYLRESKYMERLEQAHRIKMAAKRESASTRSSNPSLLSKSSSTISLKKLEPSHRGMTYEIKESRPPVEDEILPSLPSRWAELDQMGGLKVEANGLDVRVSNDIKLHDHEALAARSDHPMPPQCGIYYYEVTIISRGKDP